jgi:hypothetical protein
VPVGPKQTHPDFVVIHPRRGLLILETKDWKLDTIQKASKQAWDIVPDGQHKVVINPLEQARHCAIQVVRALERDPQLMQTTARTRASWPSRGGTASSSPTSRASSSPTRAWTRRSSRTT